MNNLSISLEDACKQAETMFPLFGIKNVVLSEAETKKAQRIHQYTANVESEGWLLVYRQSVNGIACLAPNYAEAGAIDETFSAGWAQEEVALYVDREGVWFFAWSNPGLIETQVSEQTAMLDFQTIQQLIKTRLRMEYIEGATELCVKDVRLGYCVLPKKNDQNRGYTIPVWIVNYEMEAPFSPATLYFGFAISALNGANIHLES